MDQEILALAMVLGNVSESDRQRLEVLCRNARQGLLKLTYQLAFLTPGI